MIMLKTFERSPNLAEMKVSYRRSRRPDSKQLTMPFVVSTPVAAVEYLRSVWDKETLELREEFLVVLVNSANEVIGWVKLASGGMDAAFIDSRLVFAAALQTAASGIVVAHNHPSGIAYPSEADRSVTKRLKEGAEILGIRFLDHVIVTVSGAFSFAAEGLIA